MVHGPTAKLTVGRASRTMLVRAALLTLCIAGCDGDASKVTSAAPAMMPAAADAQPPSAAEPSSAAGPAKGARTDPPRGTAAPTPPAATPPSAGSSAAATPASDAGTVAPDAATDAAEPSAPTASSEWPVGEPEDYGLDRSVLEAAAERIQRSTGNRYGMVVVRKGVLIYEKYWQGGASDPHVIYSCTKSWGSSLIGIAVTQGLLSVQDEVRKWVPEPADGVSEGALLEHLLTQSAHTTPPGQAFQYNSGYLLNTVPEVLEAASGMPSHEFFIRNLAEPLGLTMTWPACPAGGCAGTRYREGFSQFGNQPPEAPNAELPESTVRDQAKLGWLWANNGVWNGETLIAPEYIAAASKPSSGFRADYGYLWWLQNDEQFGAIGGVGNCYVNIMPSRQLVIAVMGNDSGLGTGGGWSDFGSIVDAIQD